jgi:hypothetical protein
VRATRADLPACGARPVVLGGLLILGRAAAVPLEMVAIPAL